MLHLRVIAIVVSSLLFGCSINVTQRVSNQLDLKNLNQRLETRISDLSVDSRCPGTKSLKVINAEIRTEKYCVNDAMGCKWYIIPKDMTDYIVEYIENKFKECNITVGEEFDNKILVSLDEMKAIEGVWSFGSSSKIRIQIPDINYTQTYVGESGSGLGSMLLLMRSIFQLINFSMTLSFKTM